MKNTIDVTPETYQNRTSLLLLFFTLLLSMPAQTQNLTGKWECYHKEKGSRETKSVDLFSGEEFSFSCDGLIFEFNDDSTGVDLRVDEPFRFTLKDSVLTFGSRKYLIEKHTRNLLIFKEYDTDIYPDRFRYKFRRL